MKFFLIKIGSYLNVLDRKTKAKIPESQGFTVFIAVIAIGQISIDHL